MICQINETHYKRKKSHEELVKIMVLFLPWAASTGNGLPNSVTPRAVWCTRLSRSFSCFLLSRARASAIACLLHLSFSSGLHVAGVALSHCLLKKASTALVLLFFFFFFFFFVCFFVFGGRFLFC
jgi:hypothetical protein